MATAPDISSILGNSSQSPLEQLLAAYRAQQSQSLVDPLKQRQQQLQDQRKTLATLRTKLEELFFQAQAFTLSAAAERFAPRSVTSSAPDIVTATAQPSAPLTSISVHVDRLARNDVLVSDRLSKSDPFGLSGTYRFDLTANGTTATVEVVLDGTEDTETALRKIATAINNTANIGVIATTLSDTATSARLVLTAKQTGTSAAITFTDTDGLLSRLGWDSTLFADPENRTTFSDTTAGYQLARSSELNARFTVNGISIVRESNTVADVLPGMTLTLLRSQQATDPPVTLTTVVDTDKVASLLQSFIDTYNAALKELTSALNGPLKGDPAVRQLLTQLRSLLSQPLGSGSLQTLRDIGITINRDGTLALTDRSRLATELSQGSERVAALFTSAGGLGERLVGALTDVVGSAGLFRNRQQGIDRRLQELSTRIRQMEQRVEQQVEQYRKEYLKLQQLYVMATSQLGMLNNFATPVAGMFFSP